MSKKNNNLKKIIETGSEITGAVSGTVIGGLVAGLPGMLIGVTAGPIVTSIFKKIGEEVQNRYLSSREEIRIGAVLTYALDKLKNLQDEGKHLRNDYFFTETKNSRSSGEELLEGTILSAQREYEEKKVKYLGNLYANICTNNEIQKETANQFIKILNTVSFRQLCILQVLNKEGIKNLGSKNTQRNIDNKLFQDDLLIEVRDLQTKGLLKLGNVIVNELDRSSFLIKDDISINQFGTLFCDMLSLNEIPNDELISIKKLLLQ